ncbi:MAG: hypothetical protein A4E73_02558 [Syntrophaceae bacterium PtaU1.Bin231]|nr:MAG: hypothetical protein A4E73_02558 [Syntrophaceae bacterium PtaU1.Bin231]
MPYEYLEDVAVADIAFRAWGPELDDVFTAAAAATTKVMADDLEAIRPLETREVELRQREPDLLLFDFLQEIVYFKDAERLLLLVDRVRVAAEGAGLLLTATLKGERIDPDRHSLRADVKAVTLHGFSLVRTGPYWEATVVLDI